MGYRQGLYLHGIKKVDVMPANEKGRQSIRLEAENGDIFWVNYDLTDVAAAIQSFEHIEVTA